MTQDVTSLSDAELLAIIGQPPLSAPAAPRSAAPARQPSAPLTGVRGKIEGLVPGVNITSGRRTPEHNRAVGGAPNSYHLRGQAFDLTPPQGMSMADLERQLRASGLPFAELINEGDHLHAAWEGEAEDAPSGAQAAPVVADLSDEEVLALAQGPDYAVVRSEDLAPEDTPESLRAQGYEYDPARGVWARTVGTAAAPATEPAPVQSEGYQLARQQGEETRETLGDMGGPGFVDQFTAPINDELAWLEGLGSQALGNLGRRLTGQEVEVGALERARAERDLTLEGQQEFEKEHPGQALAGGLLGGFAFAPARAAALPGLVGRLGQAGAVSSAYGVAEGDGVAGRVGSGLLSGGVGLATAGLLEGAAPAARSLLRNVERSRLPRAERLNTPERRVGGAVESALQRDGVSTQDFAANLGVLPEGRLPFEAGGENLVGLAETMAQAPGQARTSLLSSIRERSGDASNRISARLADNFGAQGNGFQALRQNIKARGAAADEGMAAIETRPVPLDDASVQAFRSRLSSRAVRDAAEEAVAELSPEGSAAANRLFGLGDDVLDNPGATTITVREAQDISYAMNEAASRAYRGGFNSRGEALKTLANSIRTNARTRVPEYDEWLTSFGDASEAIGAMRTGQNVFAKANERNAMSAAELRDQWGSWSAQARENYRLGVGEAVLDKVRGNGGVPAMRRLLRDNELADRVRIAFESEDAFLRFMQTADDEVSMANVDNQVLGGSPTVRRAAGAADVNAQGMGPMDAVEMVSEIGSPVAMGRRALGLLAKNLPRRDRSILGNEEMNALIGSALTDETAMTRLLTLLQTESGIGESAAQRTRLLGLLGVPGGVAGGQERSRGLLTANP